MKASLVSRGIVVGIAALAALKAMALMDAAPFGGARGDIGLSAAHAASQTPRTGAAGARVATAAGPRLASGTPEPVPASRPSAEGAQAAPAAPAEPPESALAAALRARREALDERERALTAREAVLGATERRLAARVAELGALQCAFEAQERSAREREAANWLTLAKLYEAMRPREAAAVFNELDMPILVQVVNRMGERKAAPILGAMQPERVRQLTAELAKLRGAETTP